VSEKVKNKVLPGSHAGDWGKIRERKETLMNSLIPETTEIESCYELLRGDLKYFT
jgi:hypothetical protein